MKLSIKMTNEGLNLEKNRSQGKEDNPMQLYHAVKECNTNIFLKEVRKGERLRSKIENKNTILELTDKLEEQRLKYH